MTLPRKIREWEYVYPVRLRATSAGSAVTIPVDAIRSLRWKPGDTIVVVLLDDGLVLSRADGSEGLEVENG